MVSGILSISFCPTRAITQDTDTLISALPFGSFEQERLRSIKNSNALKLSLCALLSLKSLIDEHYPSTANLDLTVLRTENRKPYFKSLDCFFSLSHTDGIALCVLGDKPVGIDIECIEEKNNFLDISKRFFSQDEQAYISESASPLLSFYSLWTKKEAYAKLMGEGLISVCRTSASGIGYCKQYLLEYEGKKAIISLCSTKPDNIQIHDPKKEFKIYELQN